MRGRRRRWLWWVVAAVIMFFVGAGLAWAFDWDDPWLRGVFTVFVGLGAMVGGGLRRRSQDD